jgi:hypothetical protein
MIALRANGGSGPLVSASGAAGISRPLRLSRVPAASPGACEGAAIVDALDRLTIAVDGLSRRLDALAPPVGATCGEAPDIASFAGAVSAAPMRLKWAAHHLGVHRRTVLRRALAAGAAQRVGGRWLIDVARIERPRYARRPF